MQFNRSPLASATKDPMTATLVTEIGSRPESTLPDIEAALRALDGADRTLASIELDSGATLTVGGGPREFVAEIALNDFERWAVTNLNRGESPIDVIVGGQSVDYPARLLISLDQALEAAKAFFLGSGARSEKLNWSVES